MSSLSVRNSKVGKYNDTSVHFDITVLPSILIKHLPAGPLSFADFGCGDGPLFSALARGGYISPNKPVYAVDLAPARLKHVTERFPYITAIVSPSDSVATIPDGARDFVCSTMVMEHVPDEVRYLDEIRRVLRLGGRAYITTVYKKPWAWYFRKRDGKSVLDESHLREYTDLPRFQDLLMGDRRFARLLALDIAPLWFPVLDPLLFRVGARGLLRSHPGMLRILRAAKVRIAGYFCLSAVVER